MFTKFQVFARLAIAFGFLAMGGFVRADEQSTIELKVLYAGNPDSDRAEDFQQLLSQHFEAVEVMNYGDFRPDDADGFDVVIFDWTSTYPRDEDGTINWEKENGFSSPPAPQLPSSFDRPAVLIGAAGGGICNRMNIAINWK